MPAAIPSVAIAGSVVSAGGHIKSALKSSSSSSSRNNDYKMATRAQDFSETMYKAYIQDALDQLTNNHNPEPINTLTAQLVLSSSSSEAMTSDQLIYLIKALTSEVSRLDSHACAPIINAILKLKWSNGRRSEQFVAAYVRFLGVLVSSIPKWWTDVANKIISEFILDKTTAHHSVLRYILRLIPTSSSGIHNILIDNFPHKSDSTKHYVCYVRNLLKTVEYCSELEKPVWGLIFERMVQLDVELYEELEEDDEDGAEDEEQEEEEEDDEEDEKEIGKKLDGEVNDVGYDGNDDDDGDVDDHDDTESVISFDDAASDISEYEVGQIDSDISGIKQKLDSVMCLLFDYLDTKFTPELLTSSETIQLFTTLVDLFKVYVLPTHRTRSVQYMIFRTCHAHPDLLDAFLISMIELALSPSENIEKRQKAMQYISSFIARAKGLSRPQIIFVVSFLAGWLDRYITEREIEADHAIGGMGRFRMFYSVSQALFYIFCFRHSLLRKIDGNSGELNISATIGRRQSSSSSVWECDLDHLFQRMIVTKFNPLRYCKRTVVGMFAQIAQKENAAYCFTIMEQNRLGGFRAHDSGNSTASSNSASPSPLGGGLNSTSYFGAGNSFWAKSQEFVTLEGYFPFDPIVLRRAKRSLREFYVEWEDVAEDLSGSEDDSDGDMMIDDDNGDEVVDNNAFDSDSDDN